MKDFYVLIYIIKTKKSTPSLNIIVHHKPTVCVHIIDGWENSS